MKGIIEGPVGRTVFVPTPGMDGRSAVSFCLEDFMETPAWKQCVTCSNSLRRIHGHEDI
jgi:hypothetical protein